MLTGIDAMLEENTHSGKRLGLLTNEAALTRNGEPVRMALIRSGYSIVRLFSPEHGLQATYADGAMVEDQTDKLTGLPVTSLYGSRLKPPPESLSGLDAVLFDIPDVGARFYTYLWTMTYMMEACHEAGLPLIITDRPNPIGGNLSASEGPMLDEVHCSSFIGRWNIPIRHSCTPGELALFFKATRLPALQLQVITCRGWNRKQSFFEAGHPFTPTSPAIRDAETALLYPGTGLLEGINLSEGRGTGYAFKQAGAPWIDASDWRKAILSDAPEGVNMQSVTFSPEWGLYAGEVCQGLRFAITQPVIFRPVAFGIRIIQQIMRLYPGQVRPRLYPTVAYPSGENHLDRLLGIPHVFEQLKNNFLPAPLAEKDWVKKVRDYLLY